MLKNRTVLQQEVNGREFRLECPSESTWDEVMKVLSIMHAFAQEKIQAATKQAEEKAPEVIEEVETIE